MSESKKKRIKTNHVSSSVDVSRIKVLYTPSIKVKEEKENIQQRPIVYWMFRDQRVNDNWALLYAQTLAKYHNQPLIVIFTLTPKLLGDVAAYRQYGFMLKGLKHVAERLKDLNIHFYVLTDKDNNPDNALYDFIKKYNALYVVSDFSPLRNDRGWKEQLVQRLVSNSSSTEFHMVDAHNVVPVWVASNKVEYGARTIRPKIMNLLQRYLNEYPIVEKQIITYDENNENNQELPSEPNWKMLDNFIDCDRNVPMVKEYKSGELNALNNMEIFLKKRLKYYNDKRNDPNEDAVSNISPWLHFGQISAARCALEANKYKSKYPDSVKSFIEELIVRRELAENYCYYNREGYDNLWGLYPSYDNKSWAQITLKEHSKDKREYMYEKKELEQSKTHDDLWNAAQKQMVNDGKMHGFLRMYWAKKILEWTKSPEDALHIAQYLNDKYSLDGNDPNGFVGVAWSIAGLHDQGWREREIFGKIRFMNYQGCKRKFDIKKFIRKISKH